MKKLIEIIRNISTQLDALANELINAPQPVLVHMIITEDGLGRC